MKKFKAEIFKIGINPYVLIPDKILNKLFLDAGKEKGPIPVMMKIDGHSFPQTLVKYKGEWRLYLNTPMRKAAKKDVGDVAVFEISYDSNDRRTPMPDLLRIALTKNKRAQKKFDSLIPSLQKEIMRYIGNLKSEEAIERNVKRAIGFLTSKEGFIGRNKI